MPNTSDQDPQSAQNNISIGSFPGNQSASFQVTTVSNINITHISIVEDKLRVILDRQVPKMCSSRENTFSIVALIASAAFNIVSCFPPILTSTFSDGYGLKANQWTIIFSFFAFFSIAWFLFILGRSFFNWRRESKKRVVTVDNLIDIIKTP
jgi:hypothetical protein